MRRVGELEVIVGWRLNSVRAELLEGLASNAFLEGLVLMAAIMVADCEC